MIFSLKSYVRLGDSSRLSRESIRPKVLRPLLTQTFASPNRLATSPTVFILVSLCVVLEVMKPALIF